MKKLHYVTALLLFISNALFAQIGGIEDLVNDVSDTIRIIFPIIVGVVFVIGFLFNAGHFFGANADLKKGITRVLDFVLIAGTVAGIFSYLNAIIESLHTLIFSFSFVVIISMFAVSAGLYISLIYIAKNSGKLNIQKVFLKAISNKKVCLAERIGNYLHYE